jgi:ribosomal protein L37AE/L43A
MKSSSLRSRPDSLICPLCEVHKLDARGHSAAHCAPCGRVVSGMTLYALRQIIELPEAVGSHACEECAHPEMRRLPDGTRHCPACGSEVAPIGAYATHSGPEEQGEAWWAGWMDGHLAEGGDFAHDPSLARWQAPLERLAYYRGRRAGSEARRDRGAPLLARAGKADRKPA